MEQQDVHTTLRWKVDKDLELYRFYLDTSVKTVMFVMGISGAIASYALSNAQSRFVGIALAFPAVLNGGFTILFSYSIGQANRMSREPAATCKQLGVSEFNMDPLRAVCQIFSLMCGIACIGLLLLLGLLYLVPSKS